MTRQALDGSGGRSLGVPMPVEPGSGFCNVLSRFDLLGPDTVSGGMPFCPLQEVLGTALGTGWNMRQWQGCR